MKIGAFNLLNSQTKMEKIKIGSKNNFYPTPTIIVGVLIDGKPNYLNVSYAGIANRNPAMLFVSLNHLHYSTEGIIETKRFSVNIPSSEMLVKTDYCGLVSGRTVDKSTLFHSFFGVLGDVPMIEECPVNIECEVVHELKMESNVIFIGKVIESYTQERYLTNHLPDMAKIDPILLSMNDFYYYSIGSKISKAWDVGKKQQ
ncbi:flavin reductase family protein [Faecalispora anaeroviscerum]|uniref:flavin reductase family protein n=1 Tax=Faecalispora anaeroviscerum TaxID=2991836 RepID=UPI0024B937B6|nr:flavin reductase family protein [Faecalispora anaeroviscerum]